MSNMDQTDLTKNDAQHGVTKIFGSKRQDNLKRVVFGEQNKVSAMPVVTNIDTEPSTMTDDYIFPEAGPSYVEVAPAQAVDLVDHSTNEQTLTDEELVMGTLTEEELVLEALTEEELVLEALTEEEPVLEVLTEEEPVVEALAEEVPELEVLAEEASVMQSQVEQVVVPIVQIEHPLAEKVRELEEFTKLFNTQAEVLEEEDTRFDLSGYTMDPDIDSLLADKVKEFHFLGYERVTLDEIRNYIQQIRKRRPRNLHELVNTILVLQPQQVMNYDIQSAYRNSSQSLEDILSDLN